MQPFIWMIFQGLRGLIDGERAKFPIRVSKRRVIVGDVTCAISWACDMISSIQG